jgi:hypothetical protein
MQFAIIIPLRVNKIYTKINFAFGSDPTAINQHEIPFRIFLSSHVSKFSRSCTTQHHRVLHPRKRNVEIKFVSGWRQ